MQKATMHSHNVHRLNTDSPVRATVGDKNTKTGLIAHHSKELLWQRIMGEEVELCGVRGEGGVGSRGVVEPRAQRQMLS